MMQRMRQRNTDKQGEAEIHRFVLRLPRSDYAALAEDARSRKRSVNAQINVLIEKHLKEAA